MDPSKGHTITSGNRLGHYEILPDPMWDPKRPGDLIYVSAAGEMVSVALTLGNNFKIGPTTKLFDWRKPGSTRSGRLFDVSPRDGRFIMTKNVEQTTERTTDVSVILNWDLTLKPPTETR